MRTATLVRKLVIHIADEVCRYISVNYYSVVEYNHIFISYRVFQ